MRNIVYALLIFISVSFAQDGLVYPIKERVGNTYDVDVSSSFFLGKNLRPSLHDTVNFVNPNNEFALTSITGDQYLRYDQTDRKAVLYGRLMYQEGVQLEKTNGIPQNELWQGLNNDPDLQISVAKLSQARADRKQLTIKFIGVNTAIGLGSIMYGIVLQSPGPSGIDYTSGKEYVVLGIAETALALIIGLPIYAADQFGDEKVMAAELAACIQAKKNSPQIAPLTSAANPGSL